MWCLPNIFFLFTYKTVQRQTRELFEIVNRVPVDSMDAKRSLSLHNRPLVYRNTQASPPVSELNVLSL